MTLKSQWMDVLAYCSFYIQNKERGRSILALTKGDHIKFESGIHLDAVGPKNWKGQKRKRQESQPIHDCRSACEERYVVSAPREKGILSSSPRKRLSHTFFLEALSSQGFYSTSTWKLLCVSQRTNRKHIGHKPEVVFN